MKKIIYILFILSIVHSASAQYADCPEIELPDGIISITPVNPTPCEYVPMEFEELTPVWTHLSIDSTIIGYEDSCGIRRTF